MELHYYRVSINENLNLMNLTDKLAEIEVNYKTKIKTSDMIRVLTSKDACDCFREVWSDRIGYTEECLLLLLNRANKVLGFVKLSSGGTSGTVVDLRMIFQVALKTNANSIILCHNHPSGNLRPSEADIRLTKDVCVNGKLLGIPLLDHIILIEEGHYYSFADEGMI